VGGSEKSQFVGGGRWLVCELCLVLKMASLCFVTSSPSNRPLVDSSVKHCLRDARPSFDEALLQLIHVSNWRFVHPLLH